MRDSISTASSEPQTGTAHASSDLERRSVGRREQREARGIDRCDELAEAAVRVADGDEQHDETDDDGDALHEVRDDVCEQAARDRVDDDEGGRGRDRDRYLEIRRRR